MAISEKLLQRIRDNSFKRPFLTLRGQGVNDADIKLLVDALKNNTHIKKINLSENEITDTGIETLAEFSNTNTNVKTLDVSVNKFGPKGAKNLAKSKFKKLKLTGNPIGDEALADFKNNAFLLHLVVNQCDITDAGSVQILQNKTLESLSLKMNRIGDNGVVVEAPNASKLKILDLSHNGLTKIGAGSISQIPSIIVLRLYHNRLKDEGTEVIAAGKFKLRELDLSENGVSNSGVCALSERQLSLRVLILFNNKVGSLGGNKLFDMPHLNTLNLSYNEIDRSCVLASEQARKKISTLTLNGNPMSTPILITFTKEKEDNGKDKTVTESPIIQVQESVHKVKAVQEEKEDEGAVELAKKVNEAKIKNPPAGFRPSSPI